MVADGSGSINSKVNLGQMNSIACGPFESADPPNVIKDFWNST
jgi:hypothetical protein